MIQRGDTVKVIKGQYRGMVGRITTLKVRGRGRGPHASIFIQDTLATITVAIRNLKKEGS